jgi:hypothetical protein
MGWATFWASLSQTHLVTLMPRYNLIVDNLLISNLDVGTKTPTNEKTVDSVHFHLTK